MAYCVLFGSRSIGCKIFQLSTSGCCRGSFQSRCEFKRLLSLDTVVHKQLNRQSYSRIWSARTTNPLNPGKGFIALRILAFASPFSYTHRHGGKEDPASKEMLKSLPREVFLNESYKRKKKYNFVVEWLLRLWKHFRYFIRFIRLFVTFAPVICIYPITFLGDGFKKRWWSLLLFACEFSGPTFIKLGQWASTRRDLFDPEFCDLFSKLHNATKVHAWHTTKYKLWKAFGRRWQEIFVSIEKKPVGSGCIAQVHRAWMKADLVADASVLEEVYAEYDEDDLASDIEFSEGLEITGIAKVLDIKEHVAEYIVKKMKNKSSKLSSKDSGSASTNQANDSTEKHNDALQEHTPTELKETAAGETLIPVAIKVVHPGVVNQVKRDLQIIETMSQFLEFIIPSVRWLSVSECCHEFTSLLMRQIDLRYEATCLEQFVENFNEDPNVRFPRPIRPFCKKDVLVETFEEGEPITNFLKENAIVPHGLKELIAGYGVQALLQMVFVDNFVHSDLHPGNILVQNADIYVPQEENKIVLVDICDTVIVNVKPVENPVRLVLLDAGITSSLSQQDLTNFKAVFTAVVVGEGEKVAELMLKHARYNECKDIAAFKKELGHLVKTTRQETVTLGKVRVAELLSGVFSIMSRHRIKLESNFAAILLAIFVLEGLGRSLDPEMNILTKAKPILLAS